MGRTNEREVDVVCRMGVEEEDGGREEGEQREREAVGVYFFSFAGGVVVLCWTLRK